MALIKKVEKNTTVFVIKNISKLDIRIFNVPIYPNNVYDLMSISYVSEADIRASLLKEVIWKQDRLIQPLTFLHI